MSTQIKLEALREVHNSKNTMEEFNALYETDFGSMSREEFERAIELISIAPLSVGGDGGK